MPETTDPHDEALTRDAEATMVVEASARPGVVEGLVVALAPDYFEVYAHGVVYLCRARGRLRKTRPAPAPAGSRGRAAPRAPEAVPERPVRIATGDRVRITLLGADEGVIEEVLHRSNALSRTRSEVEAEHVMMANVDLAALVFAVREPEPRFDLLDRYLALCAHAQIPALILFNKRD